MYCTHCGAPIHELDQNCSACGAPQNHGSGHGRAPGPQYAVGGGAPSPTYLVPSILVTLFCCQIFGIVAIVYSAIAMGKNSLGDFMGAKQAAGTAKMWCWLGFGIGFVIILAYVAIAIVSAAAGVNP